MNDAPTPAWDLPKAAPRGLIATWRERISARWKLARMAQETPHLLEDVGLTRQQVEMEIAKPFWRR